MPSSPWSGASEVGVPLPIPSMGRTVSFAIHEWVISYGRVISYGIPYMDGMGFRWL